MKKVVRKVQKKTMIILEGELTIRNADKIRNLFAKPYAVGEERVVSVEKATAFDLSFLQLVCSAHRSSVMTGQLFNLDDKRPACFREIIKDAGFVRNAPCKLNQKGKCLWMEDLNEQVHYDRR